LAGLPRWNLHATGCIDPGNIRSDLCQVIGTVFITIHGKNHLDKLVRWFAGYGVHHFFNFAFLFESSVRCTFSKSLSFFNEWLEESKTQWLPLLRTQFGEKATLDAQFTGTETTMQKEAPRRHTSQVAPLYKQAASQKNVTAQPYKKSYQPARRQSMQKLKLFAKEVAIDTSDTQTWPIVHLVMQFIPGTVTELRE